MGLSSQRPRHFAFFHENREEVRRFGNEKVFQFVTGSRARVDEAAEIGTTEKGIAAHLRVVAFSYSQTASRVIRDEREIANHVHGKTVLAGKSPQENDDFRVAKSKKAFRDELPTGHDFADRFADFVRQFADENRYPVAYVDDGTS